MSTRSGKRLHKSFHEDNINITDDLTVKSERKTRSKHLKENIVDITASITKLRKRKNYVKYPSDNELSTETTADVGVDVKSLRNLRKNTLKEQNINILSEDNIVESSKKNVRTTRRTKKLSENDIDHVQESNNDMAEDNKTVEKSKVKKNKNKKVVEETDIPKPNSKKKKGRKSLSVTVEDIVPNQQKKDSIDSFYSADGSPIRELTVEANICNPCSPNSKISSSKVIQSLKSKDSCNINLLFDCTGGTKDTESLQKNKSYKKSKKQSNNGHIGKEKDITFENDEINVYFDQNDSTDKKSLISLTEASISINLNNTYEKDVVNSDHKKLDLSFDKEHDGSLSTFKTRKRKFLDTTFESEEVAHNTKELEKKSSKRRKSQMNTTFDKEISLVENNISHEIKTEETEHKGISVFNTTYDKDDITFQQELDESVNKNNKSSVNNSVGKKKKKTPVKDVMIDHSKFTLTCDKNITVDSETNTTQRKSIVKDTTFEKSNSSLNGINNLTFEKDSDNVVLSSRKMYKNKDKFSSVLDNTAVNSSPSSWYEEISNVESGSKKNKRDTTFEVENAEPPTINTTFDMDSNDMPCERRKSLLQHDTTLAKHKNVANDKNTDKQSTKDTDIQKQYSAYNTMFDMNLEDKPTKSRKSILRRNSTEIDIIIEKANDNIAKEVNRRKSFITANEADLNETFEKCSKSSLISSDGSTPNTDSEIPAFNNISNISITSDESENIVNMTPVLIESSIDETLNRSSHTPLKREGTFTKDSPEITEHKSPKTSSVSPKVTPQKQKMSLPAPGCTPFHVSGTKSVLNITRSIEKDRRSSMDIVPRVTKVMFCSPTFDPVVASQNKKKIIKSNLKGSNKSFVYEEGAPSPRAVPRKRSYTQSDADDTRVKRKRLADCQQHSVERLSRPRTSSASAKLTEAVTPTKKTPQKAKSESKVSRTRLPNFAALHQKQFDQMESLDECQKRRARRARQLLTPTGNVDVLERSSPKCPLPDQQKQKEQNKPEAKKPPTLDSLKPGYTRFGFKLNLENNPFSAPRKLEVTKKPQKIMPLLAGSTMRKDIAKQVVMREKSFTERRENKRNENRTVIKGVRTNRRFELQMKLRNID
ncbi:hypothetical protein K1T71_010568 [Dendrolimus kikuchii]|uniref:Uncharacterized protein n=1 Tax=Dendrolimus kikuchii TaxID=765133 RepID=A0ACC1CP75_9NEOP|nr:hypothetical protein K1T71_010568 [Dendrolimus kikuchii]